LCGVVGAVDVVVVGLSSPSGVLLCVDVVGVVVGVVVGCCMLRCCCG
jgi:hypothetical protein